jgi:hypothetical protein
MKYSNGWWKKKAIKALKKTIKKFEEPDGKIFNNVDHCEFCKIYFSYWHVRFCVGCPLNVSDMNALYDCIKIKCYKDFMQGLRRDNLYHLQMRNVSSEQKELARKCVEVMEGILYILKKLPSWRFNPIELKIF